MSAMAFGLFWVAHGIALALVLGSLPALFRVRSARLLTQWWQCGAVAVVLLPVVPLLGPSPAASPQVAMAAFVDSTAATLAPALRTVQVLPAAAWLAAIWVAGVGVRLAWLTAGQRRLRRRVRTGTRMEDDPALAVARRITGVHVPVIAAPCAPPCAFGWARVQVLVPEALRHRPEDQRMAVYLHELLHVARSDVQRAYGEEAWRLLWWWHPSVWWMLAQLRLAREYEVDRAVVRHAVPPRAYVDALLWCSSLRPAWSSSPQVGGPRHALVRRVAMFCKEDEMSRAHRWAMTSAMALTFGVAAGLVAAVSPLRAAGLGQAVDGGEVGPFERVAVRPTLDTPPPRRTAAVDPVWPSSTAFRFRVHLVLDAGGGVAEARIARTLAGTRVGAEDGAAASAAAAAVLDAVRHWQFEAPAVAPLLVVTDVSVGDVPRLDAHAPPVAGVAGSRTPASPARERTPLRVGGTIGPPTKVYDVKPIYPAEALAAKVSGVVIIETTIAPDGAVSDARLLRSVPLLDQAALDAVRQWRYTPTLLNGEPVPIVMTCTVNFTLQ